MATDWDKRYRDGFCAGTHEVHGLVERFSPLMPPGLPVVDIAMGQGRDLLFLAGKGFSVYGLERSGEAINLVRKAMEHDHRQISMIRGDALHQPFKTAAVGTVIVFYFLVREIMSDLVRLLAPGGLLLYETFLKRQNIMDGPRNPLYLLEDGELLGYFSRLELLLYEEGIFTAHGKRRALARYAGRKR